MCILAPSADRLIYWECLKLNIEWLWNGTVCAQPCKGKVNVCAWLCDMRVPSSSDCHLRYSPIFGLLWFCKCHPMMSPCKCCECQILWCHGVKCCNVTALNAVTSMGQITLICKIVFWHPSKIVLLWQRTLTVVYFHQWTGASHTISWSRLSISAF